MKNNITERVVALCNGPSSLFLGKWTKNIAKGLILCLLVLLSDSIKAQSLNADDVRLGIGVKLNVGLGGKRASFYNISLAVGISHKTKVSGSGVYLVPGSHLTLNCYSKGVGTSIIDAFNRTGQIDFLASFYLMGGGYFGDNRSGKYTRLFNQLSASAIYHDFDASALYGTNFLINNHGRNQQVGSIGLNVKQAVLGYYNDGFAPFNKFAGDRFDRYWTGGGYLSIGMGLFDSDLNNHYIEYAYDRFTGNVQAGYLLSKEMLFGGIPQANIENAFLNRALSTIGYRNIDGTRVAVGLLGQCPKCDIQDGLHRILGYSRHVSLSKCQPVFLGSYQYNYADYFTNPNPQ